MKLDARELFSNVPFDDFEFPLLPKNAYMQRDPIGPETVGHEVQEPLSVLLRNEDDTPDMDARVSWGGVEIPPCFQIPKNNVGGG